MIPRAKFLRPLPTALNAFPIKEPTPRRALPILPPTLRSGDPILPNALRAALNPDLSALNPSLSNLPALLNSARAIFRNPIILLPLVSIHMRRDPRKILVKNLSRSKPPEAFFIPLPTAPSAIPAPLSNRLSLCLFLDFSTAFLSAFLLFSAVFILATEVFFRAFVRPTILSSCLLIVS